MYDHDGSTLRGRSSTSHGGRVSRIGELQAEIKTIDWELTLFLLLQAQDRGGYLSQIDPSFSNQKPNTWTDSGPVKETIQGVGHRTSNDSENTLPTFFKK